MRLPVERGQCTHGVTGGSVGRRGGGEEGKGERKKKRKEKKICITVVPWKSVRDDPKMVRDEVRLGCVHY